MKTLDIAMTAALRPEILRKTLLSLKQYIEFDGDLRLVIDVAPVGDKRHLQEDVVSVAQGIFDNDKVVCRILDESLQADAVKWSWLSTQGDCFLQWEDDWILKKKLIVSELEDFMFAKKRVGMIYLDRGDKSVFTHPGYFDSFVREDLEFFKRIKGKSIGGPPALINKKYAKDIMQIVDGTVCLDILSSAPLAQFVLNRWDTYVYVSNCGGGFVADIGKAWMAQQKLKRVKRTEKGVLWMEAK